MRCARRKNERGARVNELLCGLAAGRAHGLGLEQRVEHPLAHKAERHVVNRARLDAKPELLFRLRGVNENDLLANIGNALPMSKQGPAAGKVLEADDLSAMFGLDMAVPEPPPAAATRPKRAKPSKPVRKKAKAKKPTRRRATKKAG